MKAILKLNDISPVADYVFEKGYEYSKNVENPVGIMLRSFKMHNYDFNKELLAIARCGAGVNNIPVEVCSEKGIIVFNTPGANANAVKELVILAMLMSARRISPALDFVYSLKDKGEEVAKLVESGKTSFVGPELYGKKLAVIGLGAIGAMVANSAVELGMDVYGYDPFISVDAAWSLSQAVKHVTDFNELISKADYITLHIPFTKNTRDIINKASIAKMKNGVKIINCARGELVSNEDIVEAVKEKKVSTYFTDFPTAEVIGVEGIIALPHLGASTPEAEDNCALLASKQLVDFIENGNIVNSVNFPKTVQPRQGKTRLTY